MDKPTRDKGSYRHMLDLASSTRFSTIVDGMLEGTGAKLAAPDNRHPKGRKSKCDWTEKVLEDYHTSFPLPSLSSGVGAKWWIPYPGRRPTWDLLSHIVANGKPGLLLVEAKARVGELGENDTKNPTDEDNPRSVANDLSIRLRLAESSLALGRLGYGHFQLSADHQYQLSNRLAYMNRIACLGVPVVLIYLGWLESSDWPDNEPLKTLGHWQSVVKQHFNEIGPWDFVGEKIATDSGGSMQMVVRGISEQAIRE